MCEKMCGCLVCEIEQAEINGVNIDDWDDENMTVNKLKHLDLFDEFVKAGLGA